MPHATSMNDAEFCFELSEDRPEGYIKLSEKRLLVRLESHKPDQPSSLPSPSPPPPSPSLPSPESEKSKELLGGRKRKISKELSSVLKNIPGMLNDADIRLNLLTDFEDDEKSFLLGERSSDSLVDLQDIVRLSFQLEKVDILVDNAKDRPQSQANKDKLDEIKQAYTKDFIPSRHEEPSRDQA